MELITFLSEWASERGNPERKALLTKFLMPDVASVMEHAEKLSQCAEVAVTTVSYVYEQEFTTTTGGKDTTMAHILKTIIQMKNNPGGAKQAGAPAATAATAGSPRRPIVASGRVCAGGGGVADAAVWHRRAPLRREPFARPLMLSFSASELLKF